MQYYDYRLEAKVTHHSSCSEAEKGAGGSPQSSENDGPSQMTALLESLKYQQEVVELERKVSASQASLSAQLLTHPPFDKCHDETHHKYLRTKQTFRRVN